MSEAVASMPPSQSPTPTIPVGTGFEDTSGAFLKRVLAQRSARRPSYSLRAMAKHVGLSPAYLCQVLNGKRRLTPASALALGRKLKLDDSDVDYLSLLVQCEAAGSDELRDTLRAKLEDHRRTHTLILVDPEVLNSIKDWYHIPISEMTYLDDFEFNPKNVAHRLGITQLEAEAAIERLLRLGQIRRNADGTYEKTDRDTLFRSSVRRDAFGHFHRQMIDLGSAAVAGQEVSERVIMTQTLCIDREQLDEARTLIREFTNKMAGLFDRAERRTDTFQLNVQFFNLTDGEPKLSPAQRS